MYELYASVRFLDRVFVMLRIKDETPVRHGMVIVKRKLTQEVGSPRKEKHAGPLRKTEQGKRFHQTRKVDMRNINEGYKCSVKSNCNKRADDGY